jgi:ParB family chromosome partitioning protein
MNERRPALGKGLSALIPDAPAARAPLTEIDIDLLSPNEQQPRIQMDGAKLDELADSIRANGIIQPIVVRRAGNAYRIIAGERRWRAAQRAGLLKVPIVIREIEESSTDKLLELALVENIQRENLNPVDEALAYQRLADEHGLTQDQIATAVGKDRSSVANFLRLLKLPEEVRNDLAGGTLSMGHARALLGLPDAAAQRHVSREVISRGLSVRDTEALVKKMAAAPSSKSTPREATVTEPSAKDVHTRAAEDRLRFALGTKVRIARRGDGGTIEVDFASEAELQRLYEALTSLK